MTYSIFYLFKNNKSLERLKFLLKVTIVILEKYNKQSSAIYSSARLWDDGVIDPADTRHIVGMSLAIAVNAPIAETEFGIFRM